MAASSSSTRLLLSRCLVLGLALQGLFSLALLQDTIPLRPAEILPVDVPISLEMLQGEPKKIGEMPTSKLPASTQPPMTLEGYTRCLAKQLEVDEALALAVLVQESHPTDPFRTGKGDSRGPFQIKPIALEEVGLSRDAQQLPFLVYGGILYLKTMMTRFSDLPTALAAYNMGPFRLKQREYRPYKVTQLYVSQILMRQEQIRSATFRPSPVLHYPLSAEELAVFPDHATYPSECHLQQFAAAASATSSAVDQT